MREIKFRMWALDHMNYRPMTQMGEPLNDVFSDGNKWMQYTGLKDKNGKEIYEGDILAADDGEWTDNDTTWMQYIAGIVTWWTDNARFFLSDDLEGYMGDDDKADEPMDWVNYEVVGNIYENPELVAPNPKSSSGEQS